MTATGSKAAVTYAPTDEFDEFIEGEEVTVEIDVTDAQELAGTEAAFRSWAASWEVEFEWPSGPEDQGPRKVQLNDGRTMLIEGIAAEVFGQPVLIAAACGHPASLNFVTSHLQQQSQTVQQMGVIFLQNYGQIFRQDPASLNAQEQTTKDTIEDMYETWLSELGLPPEDQIVYGKVIGEDGAGLGYVIPESDIIR
jgi:hypothetical protein